MKASVLVSSRGQITLPAGVRKRLGIKSGGVILIEERAGELVLRPAAVLEVEHYTDDEIATWDEQDQVSPADRKDIVKKAARRR
jgi:AbrB family looped-hinge helix DNA binding protein